MAAPSPSAASASLPSTAPTGGCDAPAAAEADPTTADDPVSSTNLATEAKPAPNPPTLSKNALKKAKRKQEWEDQREHRKTIRRTKAKARKARRREDPEAYSHWQTEKRNANAQRTTTPVPLTIIYDCGYDDLMTENERISLASQLTRAYSDVRKARWQPVMCVSGFNKGGKLRERFENVLGRGHEKWKGVRFLEEGFVEASKKSEEWMAETGDEWKACEALSGEAVATRQKALDDHTNGNKVSPTEIETAPDKTKLDSSRETIYLSSDSPNTLTALKPNSTYIIGALVDKNRHKGACYKAAVAADFQTAKLPIREFMSMSSRQVLATSHVGEIMLKWLEHGDWGKAFVEVIPQRKGGVLKDNGDDGVAKEAANGVAGKKRKRGEEDEQIVVGDDADEDEEDDMEDEDDAEQEEVDEEEVEAENDDSRLERKPAKEPTATIAAFPNG